jgi:hypothetical protein
MGREANLFPRGGRSKAQGSKLETHPMALRGRGNTTWRATCLHRRRNWEEEEEGYKTSEAIPIELVKLSSTGDRLDFIKFDPTTAAHGGFRGCTIHESLEKIPQEQPKAHKGFTVVAHISVGFQERSFWQIPTTSPIQHRIHHLEVQATSSKIQSELLCGRIKEMENGITEKTNKALATTSMRIITNLEEMVRVHKIRITNLETTNGFLLGKLTRTYKEPRYRQKGN